MYCGACLWLSISSALVSHVSQHGRVVRLMTCACPCPPHPQYALAAHSVSQLHAVDGGTTYGLPYDSLMPPFREMCRADLSCHCMATAVCWWMHMCRMGGFPPCRSPHPRPLAPRGLFELCLREAEVAADCWRRRNGLPAAAEGAAETAEAAVGAAGASGGKAARGGPQEHGGRRGPRAKSSGTRAEVQGPGGEGHTVGGRHSADGDRSSSSKGRIAGGTAGLSCGTGQKGPGATLDAHSCSSLALLAVNCSRLVMECCSRDGSAGGGGDGAAGGRGKGAVPANSGASSSSSSSGQKGREGGRRAVGSGCSSGGGACAKEGGGGGAEGPEDDGSRSSSSGSSINSGAGGGSDIGSGAGGEGKCPVAWIGGGGPLARRWWRAAVAAVHCRLDDIASGYPRAAFECIAPVVDLSLFMPPAGTGEALTWTAPSLDCGVRLLQLLPCYSQAQMDAYNCRQTTVKEPWVSALVVVCVSTIPAGSVPVLFGEKF